MLRIALGTVKARTGGILGALVGVTVAISLVVSSGIVLESTLRAEIPVERLDRAAVVVDRGQSFGPAGAATDEPLPERTRIDGALAERLRLPCRRRGGGSRPYVSDRDRRRARTPPRGPRRRASGRARLEQRRARRARSGRGPRAARRRGRRGRRRSRRTPVPCASARPFASRPPPAAMRSRSSASPRRPRGRNAPSSPAAYFRDDVAGRLSGTGDRVELIGITVRPGTDVQALADRVRDGSSSRPGSACSRARSAARPSRSRACSTAKASSPGSALLAALGTFVAIFVVSSAFALSVQQRHRELALLRAIGATPRQVRRMIAVEALVIAVAGTVLAFLVGVLMAMAERRLFIRAGVLPADFRLVVGWIPVAVGLAAAVVTTQLASFVSGRRASRIRPVDALREAAVERRLITPLRAVAGLAALVVGLDRLRHDDAQRRAAAAATMRPRPASSGCSRPLCSARSSRCRSSGRSAGRWPRSAPAPGCSRARAPARTSGTSSRWRRRSCSRSRSPARS